MSRSRRLRALFLLVLLLAPTRLAWPSSAPALPMAEDGGAALDESHVQPLQLLRQGAAPVPLLRLAGEGTARSDLRLDGTAGPLHPRSPAAVRARVQALRRTRLLRGTTLPGPRTGRLTLHTTTLPPPTAV